MKTCNCCGEEKSYSEYYPRDNSPDGYRNTCRVCIKLNQIQRQYDLTKDEFLKLFEHQDGQCAICDASIAGASLYVDHDHLTGQVRGLLCNSCNLALGHFKDDAQRLNKALNYLEHFPAKILEKAPHG